MPRLCLRMAPKPKLYVYDRLCVPFLAPHWHACSADKHCWPTRPVLPFLYVSIAFCGVYKVPRLVEAYAFFSFLAFSGVLVGYSDSSSLADWFARLHIDSVGESSHSWRLPVSLTHLKKMRRRQEDQSSRKTRVRSIVTMNTLREAPMPMR